jgi:hypothetical protein
MNENLFEARLRILRQLKRAHEMRQDSSCDLGRLNESDIESLRQEMRESARGSREDLREGAGFRPSGISSLKL